MAFENNMRDGGMREGHSRDGNSRDGNSRGPGARREKKKGYVKKKVCRFCSDQHFPLSYRDPYLLRGFTTERGKIIPRRISGNCAHHQRTLTTEIKRARILAFLSFSVSSSASESAAY